MRASDAIKLSTRMFKTNPARTWLTILGMGVGTSAVVMLVGLGFGLQQILLEQIILGDTLLSLNVRNPGSHAVVLNEDTLNAFRATDNVVDVSPLAQFSALITLNGVTGNITLQGVNPTYFRYAGVTADSGELFKDDSPKDSVVLSKAALKLFQVKDAAAIMGQTIKIRVFVKNAETNANEEVPLNKDYVVRGISNDAAAITATVALSDIQSQLTIPYYERAQVKVSATNFLSVVQNAIVKRGFTVTALSQTVDQANKIFQGLQAILAVFGGIALVVSAIGMFNTMTVTLLERTGEIGIMRTIGASPRDIKILFISEAVVVGFLGGLVGMGIGVAIGLILNLMVNIAARSFGGTAVNLFSFPLTFLAFITVFSAIVGFLTGVFPARRAGALSPLDAIRYK
ncbi:MAG TPA: ABC transporter permease [Candidatus Paceibacterota bacterium]|nr:ABC transporter permease [Candidatus Paceibacterota bacterium]